MESYVEGELALKCPHLQEKEKQELERQSAQLEKLRLDDEAKKSPT